MFLLNIVAISIYEHIADTSVFDGLGDGAKFTFVIYLVIMLIGDVRRMTD